MSELRFTVYGPIVSANNFKAPDREGKLRKTREARRDAARVSEIAAVAVASQGWEKPDAAAVRIIAWNSRLDAGNVEKIPNDSLKGIAWRDDSDVLSLRTDREWDDGGERYEIFVTPMIERRPWRLAEKRATKRATAPAWRPGDPIPDGWADLNGELVPRERALAMILGGRR